jgi:uncharacterized protein with PQ loop repeat
MTAKERVIMEIFKMQMIAGVISSLLFATSNFPMLIKVYRTKNLASYSLGNIVMNNIGNLVHWLYVSSLPYGPIWFLHGFYTLVTFLMLVWYVQYETGGIWAALNDWTGCLLSRDRPTDQRLPVPNQNPLGQICTCPVLCLCRLFQRASFS